MQASRLAFYPPASVARVDQRARDANRQETATRRPPRLSQRTDLCVRAYPFALRVFDRNLAYSLTNATN